MCPHQNYWKPHGSTKSLNEYYLNESHQASMNKLLDMMKIDDIENQKKNDLDKGILSGYGVISMCEVTNPSPLFYGVGGAHLQLSASMLKQISALCIDLDAKCCVPHRS